MSDRSQSTPGLDFRGRQGFCLLAMVLLIAVTVRLSPLLFEIPEGRDQTEYRNIAENLGMGRGFVLDIKAYHATETPVQHYSGYERAPLFPVILSAFNSLVTPRVAERLVGPIIFLILLFVLFDTIVAEHGAKAAFWTTLLVALQPGLMEVSLNPATEVVSLLLLSTAFWGFYRLHSPTVTGLACALAFLNHVTSLLGAFIFVAAYLYRLRLKRGRRDLLDLFVFILSVCLGPVALMVLNLTHGAPALLTPANFLLRRLSAVDRVHYFHLGTLYASPTGLLADQPLHVGRAILHNMVGYIRSLAGVGREGAGFGLGYLLPLTFLAWVGFVSSATLRPFLLLGAIGAVHLLFFILMWMTYDPVRFVAVPLLCAVVLLGLGLWKGMRLLGSCASLARLGLHTPLALFLPAALLMGAEDGYRSYLAWRDHRLGKPYSYELEKVWDRDDVRQMRRDLNDLKGRGIIEADVIFASNEPWLTHSMTSSPAVLIPYDLDFTEWTDFLARWKVGYLVLHRADWPTKEMWHQEQLISAIQSSGWRRIVRRGALELWQRP